MEREKYNSFVKHVELNKIVLYKLDSQFNYELLGRESGQVLVDFKPSFNLKRKEENKFLAEARFSVSVKVEESNEELIKINASFLLFYSLKEKCDDDILEEFIKRNVPLNAWPYGRELISSMTSRMGLPALNIGLYKVY
ncbi:protein-export chaperone SecB [Thermosediminibacter litoriperuensis]|uniref:Preprotein translocase subunit SecB n=1 Tax=Thermosediminibacter litoriperuensis TaxID=291989 RepID=A0A5S5ALU5_9FIRM|nr:protein-export chaperone SecB [Thermosediminibacter litoriperuensis]TYP52398.1 preprotein translocase subunit SecB [Thermosediminibacter litoriperuensis]